jgi:hypothetical protein
MTWGVRTRAYLRAFITHLYAFAGDDKTQDIERDVAPFLYRWKAVDV